MLNISAQCLCQWFHGYCCPSWVSLFLPLSALYQDPQFRKFHEKYAKSLKTLILGGNPLSAFPGTLPSGRGVELYHCPKCTERKGSIISHFQSVSLCWTFPLAAFPACFGIAQRHKRDSCAPWSAGSRTTGWWQGEVALEGAVTKPRVVIQLLGSSGWERTGTLSSEHSAVASPQNRSHMPSLSSLTV